jgi:subtilase family serine protease
MATAPNPYFLLACADDTSKVAESNETNNCRASTATVQVGSSAGAPDLVETSVSNPPGSASPGGTFSVTDSVSNQGTATAAASTTRFYLSLDSAKDGSDILLTGNRSVPSLAAGAASSGTVTVTVPTTTAPNTYFLLACADDTSLVTESNETNNCRTSTATVQVVSPAGAPDLVETSVSNPPGSASPGGTFSVTDNVSNQGTATAVASTTRFYLSLNAAKDGSDILLTGSRSVPSLAAGAASSGAVTVTIPATTALNTYFLLACADDTSLVAESNEANNCLASTTTVQVVASPGATFSLNPTSLVFAAAADGSFVASTEAVTITASNPSLAWSVSYDVTWLAVSPPSGIGSGAIFILPSATGLVPGTYHATVTVTGGGSSQQVAITFNVF